MLPQSTLVWQVCITLFQALALISTGVRLVYRIRTRRWWWDDVIVVIPLVFDSLFISLLWLTLNVSKRPTNVFFSPWFSSFSYVVIIWAGRISVTLSIGKIIPQGEKCRVLAFAITALFSIFFTVRCMSSIFKCYDPTIDWYNESFAQCVARRPQVRKVTNISPIFDLIADVLMIALPLCVLWTVRLRPKERQLLKFVLLSISILSFLASIAFLSTWFLNPQAGTAIYFVIRIMGQVQAAVTLFVCNLLDMAMLIYQLLYRNRVPRRRRLAPRDFPLRSIGRNRGTNNGKNVSASSGSVESTLVLTSVYDDYSDSSMQSHNVSTLSNIDGSSVNHSSVHITSPSPAHLRGSHEGNPIAGSSGTLPP